jgi:hypothetical protein
MPASNSDPPETLAEAAEKFKKFLSAQHWPEMIASSQRSKNFCRRDLIS